MSLSSLELNYLIWRYLQESDFGLAAYALQKDSSCLDYENNTNKLVQLIEPGCLVNLVQKGILYSLLEDSADENPDRMHLINAILKDKAAFIEAEAKRDKPHESTAAPDVAMKEAEEPAAENEDESGALATDKFVTKILHPFSSFSPSLASSWHPNTEAFAVGNEDSNAVIHALGASGILESVTLSHPPVIVNDKPVENPIVTVSWSPQGTMVLTSGMSGEIRAWTPDGRLKNIVNSLSEHVLVPAAISSLVWNPRGLLLLSIDVHNTLRVWDGQTLLAVSELKGGPEPTAELHACWVSETKFAATTRKNGIKIFSVGTHEPLVPVGQLSGHQHSISNLCFSPISKLLASASDHDYEIKVWNSLLTLDAVELNVAHEQASHVQYHTTPIICLEWLCTAGDVQGNLLLSVSMEGTVNIWDAFTGDCILSTNIFKNGDNYNFAEDDTAVATANALVFSAAVSPDGKYLAVGDDSGNVSFWDIHVGGYKAGGDVLRCLGIYALETKSEYGICDLSWGKGYLSACYKGRDSVLLQWPEANGAEK